MSTRAEASSRANSDAVRRPRLRCRHLDAVRSQCPRNRFLRWDIADSERGATRKRWRSGGGTCAPMSFRVLQQLTRVCCRAHIEARGHIWAMHQCQRSAEDTRAACLRRTARAGLSSLAGPKLQNPRLPSRLFREPNSSGNTSPRHPSSDGPATCAFVIPATFSVGGRADLDDVLAFARALAHTRRLTGMLNMNRICRLVS